MLLIKTKLYWLFVGLLSLFTVILFSYGLYTKYANPQTLSLGQQNKTKEAREAAEQIQKQLKALGDQLAKENQQRALIRKQYDLIDYEINQNIAAINTLNTNITEKEQTLAASFDTLSAEEKTQLQEEINVLKKQRDEHLGKGKALIIQRKNLDQEEQKIIQNMDDLQQKTKNIASLASLTDNINLLQETIQYNYANKTLIKKMLAQAKDNKEEIKNLKSYDLFLDEQLLYFGQQVRQLEKELNAKKNNQLYQEDKAIITFKDVFGMEREKEALQDLIYYFKSDQKLVNFDKVTPRGYLLYGPPGTGKSYLMKALCGEAGDIHFIEIEPSKFDKTYVGEGNEELEKIWAEAEQYDKTIIFIDEISGLANREDKNTSQTASNILNNLLTKLDGFKKSDKKIILMGATNHLEKIDSALRSRFSEEIKIDLIKNEEIAKFLKFLVKPFQISYHTFLHLNEIAKRCENKHYSNRALTELIEGAYKKTNRYKYENPLEHEVMLPSDLDEVLDNKQNIVKSQEEIIQRRKACEEQYATWKEGFQRYLPKPKDMTKVEAVYTFYGLEGLGYYQKIMNQLKYDQHPLQKELKTLLEQKDKLASEVIALEQDQARNKTFIEQKQNAITLLEQQIKNLNNEITEEKELCEERIKTQKEPTDLAYFVKHPFNQWK
ncbi:AAA family ATPase, partial [Italian clover phyllody phytoplasma]|uniref:AAA family ATPase n=1 Tax=Italian clover phyllody phytoplasma TaxID=1196420 RepID=UPI000381ABFF